MYKIYNYTIRVKTKTFQIPIKMHLKQVIKNDNNLNNNKKKLFFYLGQ